jgi:hypothetical protein
MKRTEINEIDGRAEAANAGRAVSSLHRRDKNARGGRGETLRHLVKE